MIRLRSVFPLLSLAAALVFASQPTSAAPASTPMTQFGTYNGVALPTFAPGAVATSQGGWSLPVVAGDKGGLEIVSDLGLGTVGAINGDGTPNVTYRVHRAPGSCLDVVEIHRRNAGSTFPTLHWLGIWDSCNAGLTANGGWVWAREMAELNCMGLSFLDTTEQRYKVQVAKDASNVWRAYLFGFAGATCTPNPAIPPGSNSEIAYASGTRIDGSTTGAVAAKVWSSQCPLSSDNGNLNTHLIKRLNSAGTWYLVTNSAAQRVNITKLGCVATAPRDATEFFSGTDAVSTFKIQ